MPQLFSPEERRLALLYLRPGSMTPEWRLWYAMRLITMYALLFIAPGICLSDEVFRCGTWLVSADMSVADLLKKCGKPSSQEFHPQAARNQHGIIVGTSTTEIWRYDRGARAAPMIVTIVDGQIRSIERGK